MSLRRFLAGQPPARVNGEPSALDAQRRAITEAARGALPESRPPRDPRRLAAARDAAQGAPTGAAAWESLAARGLIPLDWVGDPNRFFYCEDGHPAGYLRALGPPDKDGDPPLLVSDARHTSHVRPYDFQTPFAVGDLLNYASYQEGWPIGLRKGIKRSLEGYYRANEPEPTSIELAVALAADPEGVRTVEALAREMLARLTLWGADPQTRLIWRLSASEADFPGDIIHASSLNTLVGAMPPVGGPDALALARERDEWVGRLCPSRRAYYPLRYTLRHALAWFCLRASDARVYAAGIPSALIERRYADLPDPFEPLLAILARGYAINEALGPNLVLRAPPFNP